MGKRKGLPAKYAKMGFKKGWRAYKASKRKRGSPGRKRSSPKKSKKSYSRRYTKRSNPSSGARSMKMGAAFRKLKAILGYGGGVVGAATYPSLGSAEAKVGNAVARYTGYQPSTADWDIDRALPTWQGVGTNAIIDMIDAKTRHYGNVSRMKLLDIAEEAIPLLYVYNAGGDVGQMANNYVTNVTGYNPMAGTYGSYSFNYAKPYLTMKAARIGLDMFGVRKWINRKLPKGINL